MPTDSSQDAPGAVPGLLLAAILFGLFVLGSHPASAGLFTPPWDKLAHLTVFATLAASIQARWPKLLPLWVVAFSVLIGFADEMHQILVPQRQPDWADGMADLAGSIVGLLAWHGVHKYLRR
jgi:VanZ family protein